jgi:transcriptional regulator with XRE-family HTH domain
MKLSDALKKERELKGISIEAAALNLHISVQDYSQLEKGHTAAEKWGVVLTRVALKLQTPTSRLISENGRTTGIQKGMCGKLIRQCREMKKTSLEEVAASVGVSTKEYEEIERGESPLEIFGPQLLRFAELIEQPIYNLLYPCGVSLEKLEDYP